MRIHELDEDGCRKEFNGKSECDRMDKHVDMLRQQLMVFASLFPTFLSETLAIPVLKVTILEQKAQQQIETHEANWRDHLKSKFSLENVLEFSACTICDAFESTLIFALMKGT